MYSDPKDCLYCTNNETLHNLMIEIGHLRVSRAFGHGIPFAIGLTLFHPLFVLYLGFGPDRYRRLDWSGSF